MGVLLCFKIGSHEPQFGLKRSQDLGAKMKMCLLVSPQQRGRWGVCSGLLEGQLLGPLELGNQNHPHVHSRRNACYLVEVDSKVITGYLCCRRSWLGSRAEGRELAKVSPEQGLNKCG